MTERKKDTRAAITPLDVKAVTLDDLRNRAASTNALGVAPSSATNSLMNTLGTGVTALTASVAPSSATNSLMNTLGTGVAALTATKSLASLASLNTLSSATSPSGVSVIEAASDLGRLIRIARQDMRLSQQQFADLAGVGRRFVSELENGKSTLEFGLVLQVCRAAGIDINARRRQSR